VHVLTGRRDRLCIPFICNWAILKLLAESIRTPVLLEELPPDTVASVTDLNVHEDDAIRLKAMGICVGRKVQLVRAGDPLIIRVLGTRVGLSARLATGIVVEPIPAS